MIIRRSVFKQPLCTQCTNYLAVKMQDDSLIVKCQAYNIIPLTPENLATDCTGYNDKLRDRHWEAFNKLEMEIPIIGEKKTLKAGFKVKENE